MSPQVSNILNVQANINKAVVWIIFLFPSLPVPVSILYDCLLSKWVFRIILSWFSVEGFMFCLAIRKVTVSLLRFPFLIHAHAFSWAVSLVFRLKYLCRYLFIPFLVLSFYCCFSACTYFTNTVTLKEYIIIIIIMIIIMIIVFPFRVFLTSVSRWIITNIFITIIIHLYSSNIPHPKGTIIAIIILHKNT